MSSGSWRSVTLGEVAELSLGKMLDGQKNKGRLLPYLRNPNIRWLEVDTSDIQMMRFEEREDERFGLRAGDVVICEGGEAGRAAIWDGRIPEMKFQKAVHRVRTGDELDARFLVHRLMADYRTGRLADYYTGATIKHLTGQELARYRFELPSIAQQRRIVAILDRADALRVKRRAVLAHLETLARSIFFDTFGDAELNPKRLPTASLGDLMKVKSGEFLPASAMTPNGTFPVFGGNGISGFHDAFMFEGPQIVLGRVGAYCGCVHVSPPRSWVTDNALFVSERRGDVELDYLVHALANAKLNQFAGRSGQPLISAARIYPVKILVPPRDLQVGFGAAIRSLDVLKHNATRSSSVLDALFASLQHRAFRGEL